MNSWDGEFISVQVRVVLNLPPHLSSVQLSKPANHAEWYPAKNSIRRRQSQLIPNNEKESQKKLKLVGQAWPLRYLCSALWLTDWAIKLIRTNVPWKNEDVWCTQNTNWGSTWYIKYGIFTLVVCIRNRTSERSITNSCENPVRAPWSYSLIFQ